MNNIKIVNIIKPNKTKAWFSGFGNIKSVDGLSNLDTSSVTDMSQMFQNCKSLDTLVLSGFDKSSNVKNMKEMFVGCTALKTLDLSEFNTSSVTSMNSMFKDCSVLEELDLSKFNTSSVTDMEYMFNGCKALDKLNVSSFNTETVEKMAFMFMDCSNLETLDLSSFVTPRVTTMLSMFSGCSSLDKLNVSKFDMTSVTHMSSMFSGCVKLKELDLSNFYTPSARKMWGMFINCMALEELDVSGFDTTSVSDMQYLFWGCSNLTRIYAAADTEWNKSELKSQDMFFGCKNLKGGLGTTVSGNPLDASYARIDGLKSNAGYFTQKVTVIFDTDEGTPTPTPAPTPTPTPPVPPASDDSVDLVKTSPIGLSENAMDVSVAKLKTDGDIKGSTFGRLRARGVAKGKKSLTIKWTRAKGAHKYILYGNQCNKKGKKYSYVKIKTFSAKTLKYSPGKINKKTLKKGTYYKFMLVAVDKESKIIAVSKTVYVTTGGGKKGNYKSVKRMKPTANAKYALKSGKSVKLKVKQMKE